MVPIFVESSMAGIPAMDLVLGSRTLGRLTLRSGQENPQELVLKSLLRDGCRVISPVQVHGTGILEDGPVLPYRSEGDGVLLTSLGLIGTIQVADCLPILISGGSTNSWKLMLHSGFRGTIANIVKFGWLCLINHLDVNPQDVFAWVGPGIGPCCYCRSLDDQWSAFAKEHLLDDFYFLREDKIFFDLGSIVLSQLRELGIPEQNIAFSRDCTACHSQRYLSYRMGAASDRMVLISGTSDATFAPLM